MSNTLSRLHAAICADPTDIPLRLVYADRLEEEEKRDRAEFIRVQIELAGPCVSWCRGGWEQQSIMEYRENAGCVVAVGQRDIPCRKCYPLRQREQELLKSPAPGQWVPNPGNAWYWSGEALQQAGLDIRWSYRNGFPDRIECDCSTWLAHGPTIVRATPVCGVVVRDKKPQTYHNNSERRLYGWQRGIVAGLPESLSLPVEWWQIIVEMPECQRHGGWADFTSEQAALDALGTAARLWARRSAGMEASP